MQADTAVVAEIVEQRYPFSRVSEANILVCPSLEAANISYKLLERIGGAEVIGPVLLGMGKSVHVLQAGDEVQKIVRMAAMAVMDAQIRDGATVSRRCEPPRCRSPWERDDPRRLGRPPATSADARDVLMRLMPEIRASRPQMSGPEWSHL